MSHKQRTLAPTQRTVAQINRPLPGPFDAREPKRHLPWWAWVIVAEMALVLFPLLWWWLRRSQGAQRPRRREVQKIILADRIPAATSPPAEQPTADDLKRIEGIGPKISSVFQQAGITTFAHLAVSEASRLERILQEAGITLADPGTWPEQAELAAADDWGALEQLQGELKGGRRV